MARAATARRASARLLAWVVVVAASAVSTDVLADGLFVRRTGANDCPDAVELSKRIRALTPKAPEPAASASTGEPAISVEFGHRGSRLQAVIRATGEKHGTRVLDDDGPSCAPLAEATALAIAILVDPEAAAAAIAKEGSPPPPPVDAAEKAEAVTPPAVEPPRESPPPKSQEGERNGRGKPWGLSIDGGAGVMTGVIASVSPFFTIGVAVRPIDLFSFEASALIAPPRSHDLDRGAVVVSFVGGRAAGCVWPVARAGRAAIDAGGCLGAVVAAVRGEGRGYDTDRSASRAWGALDAHFAMRGALLGPFGWGLRAGAVVPFHRESFGVAGAGTAYEMAAIGAASMIVLTAKIR